MTLSVKNDIQSRPGVTVGRQIVAFSNIAIAIAVAIGFFVIACKIILYSPESIGLKSFLIYCAIPGAALISTYALFKTASPWRSKMALLILSSLGAVYTAEAIVRQCVPPMDFANEVLYRRRLAASAGIPFDHRTMREVLDHLKANGVLAWPNMVPSMAIRNSLRIQTQSGMILPLGGISDADCILGNESGQYVTFHTDRHGFNNPRDHYDSEYLDIAVIGDSVAQGACVPADQNAVAVIAQKHEQTLNFGSGGNGPLVELATLREFAMPLRPKIVLWFFFEGNDLTDLVRERQTPLLLNYLDPSFSQGLTAHQSLIDQAYRELATANQEDHEVSRSWRRALEDSRVVQFLFLYRVRSLLGVGPEGSTWGIQRLFSRIITRANDDVRSWGGRMYFVYLPAWERFGDPRNMYRRRTRILDTVQDAGVPIIDVCRTFEEHADPLCLFPFRMRGHYTEAGYRLVGRTILEGLDRQSVVD